jgi:hypothetical protein
MVPPPKVSGRVLVAVETDTPFSAGCTTKLRKSLCDESGYCSGHAGSAAK